VVLRVSGGELAAARSQMGQCAEVLSGVCLDRGSQAVFGVAVLASAAAGFCSGCEGEIRSGVVRADGIVDGLSSAMSNYEAVDQEAAAGARALGGSLGTGAVAGAGSGWEGLR